MNWEGWLPELMDMTSMNISIPESLRKFVAAKVKAGGYGSASEYVRELIRDAKDKEKKDAELRELLLVGLEELKRGEATDYDEASLPKLFGEVKARAKARFASKRNGAT
jgi:antitoxin ParD1/3/4